MWDKDLLPKQKEAAKYFGTHARLLAGPGTGKTRVLTRRIEYLISIEKINPESIYALTFTRAAAKELRDRVKNAIGDENLPRVSTLHSFALSQLLKNQEIVSQLPKPLRIANDWEENNIIYQDLKRLLEINDKKKIGDLFNKMSANWESLSNTRIHENIANPKFLGAWQEHRRIFGYTMRAELVYQLQLSLEDYSSEFILDPSIKYLVVDEYQDLNLCDLSIIKSLREKGVEVFVAGDDDQSIYGFRKAHPDGIRNFPKEFEDTKNLSLDICMRCDPKILELGEFIAEQDVRRVPKKIQSAKPDPPGHVYLLRYSDQFNEARGVANICSQLLKKIELNPEDILILSRSNRYNKFSRVLKDEFDLVGIPFSSISVDSPLESNHGIQILALLRLVRNFDDHLAWRTLLQIRRNSVGEKKLNYLYDNAFDKKITFCESLFEIVMGSEVEANIRKPLKKDYESIKKIVNSLKSELKTIEESDGSILNWLFDFIDTYFCDENIACPLKEYIGDLFGQEIKITFNDLLRAMESSDKTIEQEVEKGSVNFLTMHKAKGLSAKVVFIVACENEYLPGDKDIDDERRLLYVSVTRARHFLFLTYCQKRTGQQQYTGSNSGKSARHISDFIKYSKLPRNDGDSFVLDVLD